MSANERRLPFSPFLFSLGCAVTAFLTRPSDTPVFSDCTAENYLPNSPSDSSLNLLLGRLIASSASTSFTNLTVAATPHDIIYGLYQCRGDLSPSDCSQCVAGAVNRLEAICSGSCGGTLQMEGCFVKYDNKSFFGVEDKRVVVKSCGTSIGSTDLGALTGLNAALMNLVSSVGNYRTSGAGDVRTVAQCVGDLSVSQCQDCISEAIVGLRSACGPFDWGAFFLAKCYARFSVGVTHPPDFGYNKNGDENSKDIVKESTNRLTGVIGLISAIATLLLIIMALYKKICQQD